MFNERTQGVIPMAKTHEIDTTRGPLLKTIIVFALPIIGVNILQILFTTADVTVLGIFTTDYAVAAVGTTTPIVNLLIGFFVGLSVGTNVLIARCKGAQDQNRARRIVGTAVLMSLVIGVLVAVVGFFMAETMLVWASCAPTVLPYATTYLRIYFLGMPVIMLYNFAASILRAVGDTLRPLIFLIIGGVLNIVLNIFFIVVVGWDVEGVAIATVASQAVSAISSLVLLIKNDGYAKLEKQHLKFYKSELKDVVIIGLPIGVSKCLFSVANVMVQSSINALGDMVMTAHSITKEFDGFILETMHGFGLACVAIVSQNYGAKKYDRIKKTVLYSLLLVAIVGGLLGVILLLFGRTLCGIMTDTGEVLDYCMVRILSVSMFYFLLGFLNVIQETIRGMGKSFTALLINILANIVLRLIYLYGFYPWLSSGGDTANKLSLLYILYPISWGIAIVVGCIVLVSMFKKARRQNALNKEESEQEKPAA